MATTHDDNATYPVDSTYHPPQQGAKSDLGCCHAVGAHGPDCTAGNLSDAGATMPHMTTSTSEFEQVVSVWSERPPCEMTTLTGRRCQRPASHVLNVHGCDRGVMCGQHLATWLRKAAESNLTCSVCKGTFACLGDTHTASKL